MNKSQEESPAMTDKPTGPLTETDVCDAYTAHSIYQEPSKVAEFLNQRLACRQSPGPLTAEMVRVCREFVEEFCGDSEIVLDILLARLAPVLASRQSDRPKLRLVPEKAEEVCREFVREFCGGSETVEGVLLNRLSICFERAAVLPPDAGLREALSNLLKEAKRSVSAWENHRASNQRTQWLGHYRGKVAGFEEAIAALARATPAPDDKLREEMTEQERDRMIERIADAAEATGMVGRATPAERPHVICLCGSTKFIEEFAVETWELELQGYIVLGCTLLPSWYCGVRDHFAEKLGVKEQRDNHHLQKIDMADEVVVLAIGGYIGESTKREIEYATAKGKPVRYITEATERPAAPETPVDVLAKVLAQGVTRMNDILAEYKERGESERPFVIGCVQWRNIARAALRGTPSEGK